MSANHSSDTGTIVHLPECPGSDPVWRGGYPTPCICDALRSCQERIDKDWEEMMRLVEANTRITALEDAREAISALLVELEANHDEDRHDGAWEALTVIDALRDSGNRATEAAQDDGSRASATDVAARNYNNGYNDGYAAAQRDAAEAILNHRMRGYLCSCGVEVNSINGHLWNVIDALRGES